jgi:hypothetical protein
MKTNVQKHSAPRQKKTRLSSLRPLINSRTNSTYSSFVIAFLPTSIPKIFIDAPCAKPRDLLLVTPTALPHGTLLPRKIVVKADHGALHSGTAKGSYPMECEIDPKAQCPPGGYTVHDRVPSSEMRVTLRHDRTKQRAQYQRQGDHQAKEEYPENLERSRNLGAFQRSPYAHNIVLISSGHKIESHRIRAPQANVIAKVHTQRA